MKDYLNEVGDYASLIVDLKETIKQQQKVIKDLQSQIEIQNAMKIPVTVALQIVELTDIIEAYKKYAPVSVVEMIEKKIQPKRGGVSKSLKGLPVVERVQRKNLEPPKPTRNGLSKTLKNTK